MLFILFFAIELFLVSFQTTLLPHFPQALGRPDLVFILIAFIGYRFDWLKGLGLVFLCGWMLDVVSSQYMGIYPIQYLFVFTILRLVSAYSPLRDEAYQVPLTALLYLTAQLILYFLFSQLTPQNQLVWSWLEKIQDTIVLLIASIPFFLLYNRLFEYFSRRPTKGHKIRMAKRETLEM